MAEIVSLRGNPLPAGNEPVADLVAEIRDLLARAEAGEIIGIAYATLCADKSTGCGLFGYKNRGLVGELAYIQHRTMLQIDSD